ncbi:Acyl-CoA dehydrogenase apdG [Fulvia fulva]|uniref:Acyl-CoA dehydrogenase apdG n=1 Tax=Passalora fulva TaxID=5499 RepID=A0A9Q8P8J3_PASFU|nr:Acyl-CoA dehydrogenase apdG [Fulvia fulva]KAK4626784.1 Acyl-CoA dehydrogenase apdG [Fulvia fulva]KAK4628003.1 Acyl-CoA dehydrogenase apdG [Fulvia fulva]UJO16951.1 Acyl-CoA dehydrogenase apdG [Fulvia fulva]WPV14132.1 Acyl-CoA dehydrogenase apdG [Fulvia fulva]WPV28990.1 Acyl-CoA dehydrogenase apdG [Fulvia fulva]
MTGTYTRDEVKKHTEEDDIWFIIDHKVYDVSDFVDAHPGGEVVLRQVAGQDATEAFYNLHRHEVLTNYKSLQIGTIQGETPDVITPQPGDLSEVPYAEPIWLTPQFYTPYYNDSHRALRKEVRKFVEATIKPEAIEKEKDGKLISQELIDKMAENNMLACRLGPGKHLHNRKLFGGVVDGKEYDYFHDLIVSQEMVRANQRGFQDGNMAGMTISLTAVHQWCKDDELRERISQEVLSGKKKICLAVTEAFAGSDVAGLRTTAEDKGDHYLVNGTKKWITNGVFCDYFVTGCRTDKGFSVLLIERSEEVDTKLIKTSYSTAAGTTYIEFNNVKVPKRNLLGPEHKGFVVIMSNFNHERWMMCGMVARWSRTALEECMKWTHQRIVFGKPLINQPVIRAKLARMITLVEAQQAWTEQITYQMTKLSYDEQAKLLSGPIGLLKNFCTRSANEIAEQATNIFGGRGITQGGMGSVVEMFNRTNKFDAILGGTEEILADLGVRQAMRFMPAGAKL